MAQERKGGEMKNKVISSVLEEVLLSIPEVFIHESQGNAWGGRILPIDDKTIVIHSHKSFNYYIINRAHIRDITIPNEHSRFLEQIFPQLTGEGDG